MSIFLGSLDADGPFSFESRGFRNISFIVFFILGSSYLHTHLSLSLYWDIFEPRIAFILPFLPSKFVKHVLSVRSYGRDWGYRNELDTILGLEVDLNTVQD